jgi:hypothetical protein
MRPQQGLRIAAAVVVEVVILLRILDPARLAALEL